VIAAGLAAGALILGACGGSDEASSTSSTAASTIAPIPIPTTAPPTVPATAPPVTPAPTFVGITSGATVVVANASSINGGAGRLSDRLGLEGFSTGAATNSSEGELGTTKIYYDATNSAAKAVADSLRLALGGGDITVVELATPAPVDTGEIGDAAVLVAMGNDIVDKSLAELQGTIAAPPTTEAEEGGG